jgi:hypothetical protein
MAVSIFLGEDLECMKRKMLSAILCGAAVLTIANWLEYAFFGWQVYAYPVPFLLWVAGIGCAVLALACIVFFFSHRYGVFLGVAAICLSWPYFSVFAWNLPWRRFIWLVRFQDHGASQVAAVFMLLAVTVYSIVQLRTAVTPHCKR